MVYAATMFILLKQAEVYIKMYTTNKFTKKLRPEVVRR